MRSVLVLCFVVRYFMSILVLQSSWWGRESWLLCLICLPGVSWRLSGSSSPCQGVVCGLWLWYFLIILTYYFSYISSLLVSILWFCIWFPIPMNVRLYFVAKMITFCIIHIGNRKNVFKTSSPPPPPEFQLILLYVSVLSYFTYYMWKARWNWGEDIPHPKCDVWASPNISICIFGVLSWI